jgi:hypothetical protein
MGCGIALDDKSCWLPAAWVGRTAADYIIPELQGPRAASVKQRLEDIYLYAGSLAFFEDASADEIRTLYEASAKAWEWAKKTGGKCWDDLEFFPPFFSHFGELVRYVFQDPRIENTGLSLPQELASTKDKFRVVYSDKSR